MGRFAGTEVGSNLFDGDAALTALAAASDRDDVLPELSGIRTGHDDILPRQRLSTLTISYHLLVPHGPNQNCHLFLHQTPSFFTFRWIMCPAHPARILWGGRGRFSPDGVRSRSPASPSARQRATQVATVGRETRNFAAT